MRRRPVRGARRAAGIALVLLVAAPLSNAHALDPPEILYREGVSENEPLGPWLPLDGAHINGLGFILGTRAQAKPASDSGVLYRLTALAVPDGHPDQDPAAFDPSSDCLSTARSPGTEVVLAIGRFEGPGSYTIQLEANLPSNGATRKSCSGGPSSTATFTIDPSVALDLLATRPVLLSRNPFTEIAKIPSFPAGGAGETQCARDATIQPDGSVDGSNRTRIMGPTVLIKFIPRSGRWTCVARARAAVSETPDGSHYTRWSPPVSFGAVSAFSASFTVPDKRPPRYTLAYTKLPPGSEGGLITLRISTGKHCPHVAPRTLRARVDSKRRVRFTFTLPEKDRANLDIGRRGVDSYGWLFRFAFAGTPLVRAAHSISGAFLYPKRHLYGHILNFPGIDFAYCVRTS